MLDLKKRLLNQGINMQMAKATAFTPMMDLSGAMEYVKSNWGGSGSAG